MKNNKSLFKNNILKTLQEIKAKKYFSIKGLHNNESFQLIPLTINDSDDIQIITLLANWRKKVQHWFPTQFNITEQGTKNWLQNGIIQKPDRILFMIKVNKDFIGHIGLNRFQFNKKIAVLDNVIRGNKKYKGIMTTAINTLMQWGRDELGIKGYTLLTHSDNSAALALYKKLGFEEIKRIPLTQKIFADRTEWIEQKPHIKSGKYNIYMRLKKFNT